MAKSSSRFIHLAAVLGVLDFVVFAKIVMTDIIQRVVEVLIFLGVLFIILGIMFIVLGIKFIIITCPDFDIPITLKASLPRSVVLIVIGLYVSPKWPTSRLLSPKC